MRNKGNKQLILRNSTAEFLVFTYQPDIRFPALSLRLRRVFRVGRKYERSDSD